MMGFPLRSRVFKIVLVGVFGISSPFPALANSYAEICVALRPPAGDGGVLFIGKAVSTTGGKTVFAVQEDFGSAATSTIPVTGGEFIRGRTYLLQAYKNEQGIYQVEDVCMSPHEFRPDEKLPGVLRALRTTPPATSMRGVVWGTPTYSEARAAYGHYPYAGVEVSLKSETGEVRRTRTDDLGIFYFHDLPAGHYEMTPEVKGAPIHIPQSFGFDFPQQKEADLEVFFHGSLSGTTECPKSLSCYVKLFRADKNLSPAAEAVELPGGPTNVFKFDELGPGDYVLAEYQDLAPDDESPYLPTYYPQTHKLRNAERIHLGLDDQVENLHTDLLPAQIRTFNFLISAQDAPAPKKLHVGVEYPSIARFTDDQDGYSYENNHGLARVPIIGDEAVVLHFDATIESIKYRATVQGFRPMAPSERLLSVLLTPAKQKPEEDDPSSH